MPKLSQGMTHKQFQKLWKKLGNPDLEESLPWTKVCENTKCTALRFSFRGTMHTLLGRKMQWVFFDLVWNWEANHTISLKELVALDLDEATRLAEEANISYPKGKNGLDKVIVSRFLLETDQGKTAITILDDNTMQNAYLAKEYTIQEQYYAKKGAAFSASYVKDLNPVRARNIYLFLMPLPFDLKTIAPEAIAFMKDGYLHQGRTPFSLAREVEVQYGLPPGDGNHLFRHLAATHQVPVSIDHTPFNFLTARYLP